MFGRRSLPGIPKEWADQTARQVISDSETALKISTLVRQINGAVHQMIVNGERVPGHVYESVDDLIQNHITDCMKSGYFYVGGRILHYQIGPFTEFMNIYGRDYSSPSLRDVRDYPISYRMEDSQLTFRELMIPHNKEIKGVKNDIPGYYMVLPPGLQDDLYRSLIKNGTNISELPKNYRSIVIEDPSGNKSIHIYNPDNPRSIISAGFGPTILA